MKPQSGEWGRVAVATVAALAIAWGAVACGGDQVTTAKGGPAGGQLTISAWPDYIDPGRNGTVAEFEDETGVSVDSREDVSDNERFFKKLQPLLEQGKSGARSILIVSDWMAKQMYDRGYLQEIDHEDLPTVFENLQPRLRSPAFDPERKFSVPWQSNMTGLWINTQRAQFDSVVEFFDPGIAGEVTMLADMRESVPIVLLAESQEPITAGTGQWLSAIKRIKIGDEVGQIRRLTGTEYTAGLNSGKLIAAVGRSVDAPLIENPNVEWVKPAQGCELSSENMVIPVGAPNTAAALAWMNYVYRPEVAADITEYVSNVSPVKGVKEVLEERGSKLARDPLVFPSKEVTDDCTDQPSPPDLTRLNRVWRGALPPAVG